jgi:peptidoglycan DL-endopeptidase CwlO
VRRLRALTLATLVGLVSTLLVAPVGAQPSSEEIEQRLQSEEERLQEMQMEAAAVVEDYNEAVVAFEEISAERAETEAELEQLSAQVEALVETAGDHARRLHKLGPTIELSSVFIAGDSTEIGARTAALGRILDGQRADLEGLEAARASMEAAEERLAEQYAEASAREAEVAAAREQVEATLSAQEAGISELQTELTAAEEREAEEERQRQAEAERQRQREAEEEAARQQAEQEAAAEQQQAAQQDEPTSNDTSSTDSSNTSDGGSDSSSQEPAPSTRQSAQVAVDTALDQVGKPYRYGANGPDAYDCSGLTSYAWRAAGVDITRTSRSQWHATTRISRSEIQPGDLVFFSRDGTPGGIGHVAMYIGGGDVVEASRSGVPVRTSSQAMSRSDILGYGRP